MMFAMQWALLHVPAVCSTALFLMWFKKKWLTGIGSFDLLCTQMILIFENWYTESTSWANCRTVSQCLIMSLAQVPHKPNMTWVRKHSMSRCGILEMTTMFNLLQMPYFRNIFSLGAHCDMCIPGHFTERTFRKRKTDFYTAEVNWSSDATSKKFFWKRV